VGLTDNANSLTDEVKTNKGKIHGLPEEESTLFETYRVTASQRYMGGKLNSEISPYSVGSYTNECFDASAFLALFASAVSRAYS
jgi:hypothetical protein